MEVTNKAFKAYDVRGVYPTEVNEEMAYRVGRIFSAMFAAETVVVGHDIRLSGPAIVAALTEGLRHGGTKVIDIGQCGTEMIYFATAHLKADGGIMVTASHNPKEYNGMKLVRRDARPISADTGLKEIGEDNLSFALLGDDTDNSKKITEFLQSQIEENLPGTKVSVQNIPFKTRVTRSQKGQFEVVVSSWGADFSDPISFLDLYTTDNSYNFGKWKNAEYDKWIAKSKTTDAGNVSARWDDMVKASKIINEDQGIVPLFQLNQPQLIRSNVKGVIQNTAGSVNNWKNVYITK